MPAYRCRLADTTSSTVEVLALYPEQAAEFFVGDMDQEHFQGDVVDVEVAWTYEDETTDVLICSVEVYLKYQGTRRK